jgi:histidine phosphotransferase ChpT
MLDFVDIRITEMLCSRLCHELASPVGAINNGIEMIEEFDDSMLPEALPLIGSSAKLVAARLAFYRMAYGGAGAQAVASLADLKELANPYFAESRISVSWPGDGVVAPVFENGWGRLILNLLPLAADTLPRGGTLSVLFENEPTGIRAAMVAEGEGPRIKDECAQAMLPNACIGSLTPRSVHAYFVSRLSANLNSTVEIDEDVAGRVQFSVRLTR